MSSDLARVPRLAALFATALVVLLVPASGAFASTLSSNGQDVTWTAAGDAGGQVVLLNEFSANDLYIATWMDPVVYDDTGGTGVIAPDCFDDDGDTSSPAHYVECQGINSVTADAGGGDDDVDASGSGWTCCDPGLLTIRSTLSGGLASDEIWGGWYDPATVTGDILNGGQGDDYLQGNDGDDILNGGSDFDELNGNDDDDELHGEDGDDDLFGGDEDDLIRAGNGDDHMHGDAGVDDIDAGDGNDDVDDEWDDGSADKVRGGAGVDSFYYNAEDTGSSGNDDLTILQNGLADDGDTEEDPGNDWDGFENIDYDLDNDARATVTSGASNDSIEGDNAIDEMSPGDGTDFLNMRDSSDIAHTVDGFPDVVDCGEDSDGNDVDTANADQFDDLINCETQNITQVESAFGDPDASPPTVQFTSPADNASLPAASPTMLTATASDDSGVQQVVFIDDGEILCSDTAAPYECSYQPTSDDVGGNTLSAWAVDNSGQFGVDFLAVTVGKFSLDDLEADTNNRDVRGPRVIRAVGRLELPEGVSAEDGCDGVVRLRVRDGRQIIESDRARVRDNCSFRSRMRLSGLRRIDRDKVKTTAKFLGNQVLGTETDNAGKTRIRRG